MSTFSGAVITANGAFSPANDNKVPNLRSLNMKAMPSVTALAGQTGNDCKLIHGDRWQQIDGNQTERINKNLKTDIMVDEIWEVHGDLTFTVDGKTTDLRRKTHFQTNEQTRFDHFVHTRTETHDQKQVVFQPTEQIGWFQKYNQAEWEKGSATLLYIAINGVKLELDMLEATEKVLVIDSKEIHFKKSKAEFKLKMTGFELAATTAQVIGEKLYASFNHAKAVASNVAAGVRAALSMPWGS